MSSIKGKIVRTVDMNCLFFDNKQWTLYHKICSQNNMGWKYAVGDLTNKSLLAKIIILRVITTRKHVFDMNPGVFYPYESINEKAMLLKWLKN